MSTLQESGDNGPDSPAPPKSEAEVIKRVVKKGHDIAKRAVEYTYDYKGKSQAQLKALLIERDNEMFVLAEEFLGQEARIQRLKAASLRKSKEVASMKQDAIESKDITNKLTDALLKSVNGNAAESTEPKPSGSGEPDHADGSGSDNDSDEDDVFQGPMIAGEPRALFSDREYQQKIRQMNLDELDMNAEADSMTRAIDINPEGNIFRYAVPMHLMGPIMGRQKATLRRIVNQTSTEIEPLSWVENNKRLMGFYILGAKDAIRAAVSEMIAVVRNMNKFKAKKIIKGHMKPNIGGKSSKICVHFARGNCTYGNNCRFTHKKSKK